MAFETSENGEKKSPLLGLREALVIEEMAIVQFKKSMSLLGLIIHDDIMDIVTNDLIYIMCNRIRSYLIEKPKRAPLGWKEPRWGAAQIYINRPESWFEPLWLHTLQREKEELEELFKQTEKIFQEKNEAGITKEEELEKKFQEILERQGPLRQQAKKIYRKHREAIEGRANWSGRIPSQLQQDMLIQVPAQQPNENEEKPSSLEGPKKEPPQ